MTQPFRSTVAIATLALCAAGAAHAADSGPYIGGSLGGPDYHGSINGLDGNSRGVAGKLFGGYQFNPYLAVEGGGFDLGRLRGDAGRVNLRGAYADALGSYPVAPGWSVLGRAGIADGRFTTTNGDTSSFGLKLGAGVQYDLTKQVALRAEYERYRFSNAFEDRPQVGMYSLGVKVGF